MTYSVSVKIFQLIAKRATKNGKQLEDLPKKLSKKEKQCFSYGGDNHHVLDYIHIDSYIE